MTNYLSVNRNLSRNYCDLNDGVRINNYKRFKTLRKKKKRKKNTKLLLKRIDCENFAENEKRKISGFRQLFSPFKILRQNSRRG